MKKGEKKDIKHVVTEEEIKDNELEGFLEPGEEILIPMGEEAINTAMDLVEPHDEPKDGYRECLCGNLVIVSEEVTICSCGRKHSR